MQVPKYVTGMMKGSESEAEKFLREASSKGHAVFSVYDREPPA